MEKAGIICDVGGSGARGLKFQCGLGSAQARSKSPSKSPAISVFFFT
jgi:hypothetical protein